MKRQLYKRFAIGFLLLFILTCSACSGAKVQPDEAGGADSSKSPQIDWSQLPAPPLQKELIAVAGFENRSTYSADRLWDTSSQQLASSLLRTGYFRVVEWEKMKQLFDWDTLSHASIVKSPENLERARRILLCEYFVSGAITHFNVNQHSSVSALSKSKQIDTTIRVDLLLQDARSGEYLSTGKGSHMVRQTYSGGMAGGQTGSWDSHAADEALSAAIELALFELIENFDKTRHGIKNN